MNVNYLSLRDLEYVIKVAEHRAFGRAAKGLNVSQPALSFQIKKLEEILGYKIFERTKKRVLVTELGREFVRRAEKVLLEARSLGNLSEPGHPFKSPFRLGAIRTSGPYLVPTLLPQFFKSFKGGKLLIREGLTDELISLLRKGDIDAVIASPTFDDSSLKRVDLFFEPFRLLLPKGHPLLEKKNITTRDLDSAQMVLLEDGHCLKDQAIGACVVGKRTGVRNFHATSLETLKHLVAAGEGYTFFPELAVTKDGLDSLIEYRQIEGKQVGRIISLYTRQEYARQIEADLLTDLIKKISQTQLRRT